MRAVSSKWRSTKGDIDYDTFCPSKAYVMINKLISDEYEDYNDLIKEVPRVIMNLI